MSRHASSSESQVVSMGVHGSDGQKRTLFIAMLFFGYIDKGVSKKFPLFFGNIKIKLMKVFLKYVGEFLRTYPQIRLSRGDEVLIRDER